MIFIIEGTEDGECRLTRIEDRTALMLHIRQNYGDAETFAKKVEKARELGDRFVPGERSGVLIIEGKPLYLTPRQQVTSWEITS